VQAQREGHPFSVGRWVFGAIGVSVVVFLAVLVTPGIVNGVAYVTKSAPAETFTGQSYDTSCHKGGCRTNTDGILVNGTSRTKAVLRRQVPLGQPVKVLGQVWDWGIGNSLLASTWDAIGFILLGLFLDAVALLAVVGFTWALVDDIGIRRRLRYATGSV
jgi:hypothetical protein